MMAESDERNAGATGTTDAAATPSGDGTTGTGGSQGANPYSSVHKGPPSFGDLTRSQKIFGALVASIALTIAVLVLVNPGMFYPRVEDLSEHVVSDGGGADGSESGRAPAEPGLTDSVRPAESASDDKTDSKEGDSKSGGSGTTSGGGGATQSGSSGGSGGSGAASPASSSKTYGITGDGGGSSGGTGTTGSSSPGTSSSTHWSDPTVQMAQHANGSDVSQDELDIWDRLTFLAPTQSDESGAGQQQQQQSQSQQQQQSGDDGSATPPGVRGDVVELNLRARHEHESYHAHDDMNINEWQDGYYILHRNSPAGDDIFALRPGDKVNIDGMHCTVERSVDVSSSEYFEDIRTMAGWDTVIFHTCHRPASSGLVRVVICRPSSKMTFGVWHDGELIDAHTWMSRI